MEQVVRGHVRVQRAEHEEGRDEAAHLRPPPLAVLDAQPALAVLEKGCKIGGRNKMFKKSELN